MHDYLWLHGRCNGFEMAGAICASLAFHVLLVLVLSSAPDYFPATGEETRFSVIWATPSSLPLDLPAAATVNPPGPAPQLRQEPVWPDTTVVAAQSELIPATTPFPESVNVEPEAHQSEDLAVFTVVKKELPVSPQAMQAAAPPVPTDKHRETIKSPEKTSTRERQPAPLPAPAVLEHPPQIAPEPERPVAAQNDDEPSADRQGALEKTVQEEPDRLEAALKKEPVLQPTDKNGLEVAQVRLSRPAPEQTRPAPVPAQAKPKPLPPPRPENVAASTPVSTPLPTTAREDKTTLLPKKKPEPARLAVAQKPEARPAAAGSRAVALSRPAGKPAAPPSASKSATGGGQPATAKRDSADLAQTKQSTKSAEKPPQARGPVIAALRGDLKLVMTGDTGIKLSVRFRAYPKSRRNKVLTRAEARQEQAIAPVLAAPRENTREALVETAREGIYLFSAEPVGGRGAKASFTLKIFEAGPRERTAALGSRSLSGPTVLVRILMPEAILWDDESAFTGSMEDSESETKFNATTGLYWKEYHE